MHHTLLSMQEPARYQVECPHCGEVYLAPKHRLQLELTREHGFAWVLFCTTCTVETRIAPAVLERLEVTAVKR